MTRPWVSVGLGALSGLAWGVTARGWMRFVATDPAFTWSGTLYVVGASSSAGLAMGVVTATGRSWTKVVGVVTLLPLAMGAGSLMLPTILLGSLAARRRTLPGWARVVAGALAVVPAWAVLTEVAGDHRAPLRVVVGVAWYVALCAWMIAVASVSISSGPARVTRRGYTVWRSAVIGSTDAAFHDG